MPKIGRTIKRALAAQLAGHYSIGMREAQTFCISTFSMVAPLGCICAGRCSPAPLLKKRIRLFGAGCYAPGA
jgi:hypothetical protein